MTKTPARGAGLRNHRDLVVFRPTTHHSQREIDRYTLGQEHVPKVRALLRTDKTIEEVARELGVCDATVRAFIKRRRLCDLVQRRKDMAYAKLEPIE